MGLGSNLGEFREIAWVEVEGDAPFSRFIFVPAFERNGIAFAFFRGSPPDGSDNPIPPQNRVYEGVAGLLGRPQAARIRMQFRSRTVVPVAGFLRPELKQPQLPFAKCVRQIIAVHRKPFPALSTYRMGAWLGQGVFALCTEISIAHSEGRTQKPL